MRHTRTMRAAGLALTAVLAGCNGRVPDVHEGDHFVAWRATLQKSTLTRASISLYLQAPREGNGPHLATVEVADRSRLLVLRDAIVHGSRYHGTDLSRHPGDVFSGYAHAGDGEILRLVLHAGGPLCSCGRRDVLVTAHGGRFSFGDSQYVQDSFQCPALARFLRDELGGLEGMAEAVAALAWLEEWDPREAWSRALEEAARQPLFPPEEMP